MCCLKKVPMYVIGVALLIEYRCIITLAKQEIHTSAFFRVNLAPAVP